jgi:hypothetical protein
MSPTPIRAAALARLALAASLLGAIHDSRSDPRGDTMPIHGRVWLDDDADGRADAMEPGVSDVWVAAAFEPGSRIVAHTRTGSDGSYRLDVPPGDASALVIEAIPPPGHYPTTAVAVSRGAADGSYASGVDFGVNHIQRVALRSDRVRCLTSGDLIEKDWLGKHRDRARRDAELVLGAEALDGGEVSVWFNHYDLAPLYTPMRTYSRHAPQPVLAIAFDRATPAPRTGGFDVVTGTAASAAGNLFLWTAQRTAGNEGYLPARPAAAFQTADRGDAQAIALLSSSEGGASDFFVGTRSPAPGRGTIERWGPNDATPGRYARRAIYPAPGDAALGEVTALALADLRGSGSRQLVVGARTGPASGQLLVLEGAASGDRNRLRTIRRLGTSAVTAVACADYDLDRRTDLVVGTRTGPDTGELQFWRNVTTSDDSLRFVRDTTLAVHGIPLSLASADLGGARNPDLVVGMRDHESGYGGRLDVYFMDGGRVPRRPVDPSQGTIHGMVPAITLDHFDRGAIPERGGSPARLDVAAAVWNTATSGELVVLLRR